jgi:NADH dehydrogenase
VKRILIFGGTGFIGRHLCEALNAHDVQVTVVTRRLPARHIQMLPRVQVVVGDLRDLSALQPLVAEHDLAINLIAILHGREAEFERLHVEWPRALAQLCASAGIQRLIQVSALGADPQGPSKYQRSKGRGEAALRLVSNETGLPVEILRPSVIFGLDDQFINLFARLQRAAPLIPLAGAGTRFQPVWVRDVAQALVHLSLGTAHASETASVHEACGPDVMTLADLVRHAGRWARCERPVLDLPLSIGKLQAGLMEWLPGRPLMSRDNVDSLRVDNVSSGQHRGLRDLSITPRSLGSVFCLP